VKELSKTLTLTPSEEEIVYEILLPVEHLESEVRRELRAQAFKSTLVELKILMLPNHNGRLKAP